MSEDKYKTQIKDIVLKEIGPELCVFLFGSRARGDHRRFSDYDIGIYSPDGALATSQIYSLKDTLQESSIPFQVDVIDFATVDDDFKNIALRDIEIWQNPSKIKSLIKSI